MHIPDAYLSPATEAVMAGVMVPVWVIAARKTSAELTSRQMPLLSIGAAFCFAIQMFNVPAVGGTTAHALGAVLLAILVGPWAALLGMTLTLAIQALMFGDGGILSLGANCFDMALVATFVGYGVFRLISGRSEIGSGRWLVASAIAGYSGTTMASVCAGLLLGIQPLVAHDVLGHALYCPFGLNVTLPAMVMTHLLTASPVEAIVTVAALSYLWRTFPELLGARARPKVGVTNRLVKRLAWVLVLTPLGLLATGSAFGEWDVEDLKKLVGYVPQGAANAHEIIKPLLPDYGFAGMSGRPWEIAGYLFSALVGCGAVALFTRGILRKPRVEAVDQRPIERASSDLPAWLREGPVALGRAAPLKTSWFEATVLKMRGAIAKTIASETVARSKGFLQSIHPTAKAIGFLSALVATGLAQSPLTLSGLLFAGLVAAAASQVPMGDFVTRVGGAVIFFGMIIAIPLAFQPGPTLLLGMSSTGLTLAATILLRLATGISLAILWNLTTPWHRMIRSFGSLGVPRQVLSTATLTYRYLFVIMETLGDMVEARTSRQVGACDKRQARAYAGAGSAVLFAKSLSLTEETHLAMQSRGFEGVIKQPQVKAWKLADIATALAGLAVLLMVTHVI